jgi:hypothetical protein
MSSARIIRPRLFAAARTLDLLADGELTHLPRKRRRRQADGRVVPAAADEADLRLDRHREDEAVVVVGMFADEVHAPWRAHDVQFPTGAEGLGELPAKLGRRFAHARARG